MLMHVLARNPIWVTRVKTIVLLVGGSLLVSIGLWVAPAAAPPPVKEDPFAGVTQNWDKNLPSASRFTVLADFDNQAVRDNNTGLVWEQAPDGTAGTGAAAKLSCLRKVVGGTKGWRLPAVAELVSLQDPSLGAPFVPTVFSGIQAGYWSATADVTNPTLQGWVVGFNNSGDAESANITTSRSSGVCAGP
jgi:Protein of unknown function (DUF1566)